MINPCPRILIPAPTSADPAYNDRSWKNYAEAVAAAGGDPVRLELNLSVAERSVALQSCHGICLPGSPADVEPTLYGEQRDPASAPADPAREATDFALLDHALKTRKPVLAICYGMQSLNVWRGGSLVQDLTPLPVNHSAGRAVAVAHAVVVSAESQFAELLSPEEAPLDESGFLRLPVNTSHHQAVSQPGTDFRVVARCPDDGVVEAIEADANLHPFLLGVQWHPERSIDSSAASRAMFAALIAKA